jgi:hypothetical protein
MGTEITHSPGVCSGLTIALTLPPTLVKSGFQRKRGLKLHDAKTVVASSSVHNWRRLRDRSYLEGQVQLPVRSERHPDHSSGTCLQLP